MDLVDVDAGGSDLTLTLTVDTGVIDAVASPSVEIFGDGSAEVELVGTLTELNAYLDVATNLGFLGDLNDSGNDAATVTVTLNDGGGTGTGGGTDIVLGTINVDISGVNDDPFDSGTLPSSLAVVEDVLSTISLAAINLTDVDAGGDDLTLTLQLDSGLLQAAGDVSVDITGSGTGELNLVGTLSELNAYLNVATNLGYIGVLDASGDGAAELTVTINDGGNNGTGGGTDILIGTIDVDIDAVNDAPFNAGALPTDFLVVEDILSTISLAAMDLVDVDAGGSDLTLTLEVGTGVIQAVANPIIDIDGSGSSTVSLTGTLADLNVYLDGVTNFSYLGLLNTSGNDADLVTISIDDGGGSEITLGTVNFDVDAINDDPVNIGVLPTDINVVTGLLSGVDLSGITIQDVDAGSNNIQLTLSVANSTIVGELLAGITVFGSNSNTLVLTGSVADLNVYLDNVANIRLLPGFGLLGVGVDALTISVNDLGFSGIGGGGDVLIGTVDVDVLL